MLTPRLIPAVLACGFLAACVTPSLETADGTGALNVTDVNVQVAAGAAQGDTVVTGRQAGITPGQFVAELDRDLTAELAAASDPAGQDVTVTVVVSEVYLAPPVERVVAGTSYIVGTVTVDDANGQPIVPPTAVRGNSDNIRLVGALGLATTQSVQNDYRGTLRGFAKTVRTAIFGAPDA